MIFSIYTLILINLLLFIFAFFGNSNVQTSKIFIFLQLIFFSICIGIRNYTIGTDTQSYIGSYISSSTWFKEPVFAGIERLIKYLGFSQELYILIISIIMCVIAFLIFTNDLPIKKQLIPIIIWLFLSNTMVIFSWVNILRQGLASFLVLYSISFLSKNSLKKSFFLLSIASCIHFSAIAFIFYYIMILLSKKNRLFSVFNSNNFILDLSVLIICFLFSFIISKIPIVALRYPNMGSKILLIKIMIAIVYYFLLKYVFLSKSNEKFLVWFNTYFFIICLSLLFYFTTEISNRFLYFSGCFEAILFGIVLSTKKIEKQFFFISGIFFNIFYYMLIINTSAFAKNFNF